MPGPGFTQTFGGNLLYPSQTNLLSLNPLTASVVLQWPIEQSSGNAPIVADIIEVVAATGGLTLAFSDARQVTTGYTALFNNIGANSFTVLNNLGGAVASIASGQAWLLYLADNSTQAGTWRIFQMGAGTSSANAAALAGAGLKAITTTLNENILISAHSADYASVDGDRATVVEWTGGTGAITLPNPGGNVTAGWFEMIRNSGTGNVTVSPVSGTIDGATDLVFGPDTSAFVVFDGTNWVTIGFGQQVNSVFDFVQINLTGDAGDVVLAGAQLNRVSYRFIGALTGNVNIIVPNTIQQYWVDNETSGAFSLTVKTTAGTGIAVGEGSRNILYCDGTNVLVAVTFGSTGFSNGSAAAPTIFFTSDPGTGFFLASMGNIGLSTEGVQRLNVDSTGHFVLEGPPASTAPTLTVNSGLAGPTTTMVVASPFTSVAASPLLELRSTAVNGFAELSLNGGGTAGTNDFSIFQNGGNQSGNLIVRTGAPLNFGTNGAIDMTLAAGGGLTLDTPTVAGTSLFVNPGNAASTAVFQAGSANFAALLQGTGGFPALLGLQDGGTGTKTWRLRAGGVAAGTFDIFNQSTAVSALQFDSVTSNAIFAAQVNSPQYLQSAALTNPTIGAVFVQSNALDGLLRAMSLANFESQLGLTGLAPLASPAFTGTPTSTTPPVGNSSTRIATTAFANPAQSQTTNGYVELPGGIIFQWGQATAASGTSPVDIPITFPMTFPSACFGVWPVGHRSVAAAGQANLSSNYSTSITTTGATITIDNSTGNPSTYSGSWFAIGF